MVISPSEYIKKCLKIDFDNSVENIIDTGASIIKYESFVGLVECKRA